MARESSKISFASLTCEKFPCMRVFACLFFLFYCSVRCGFCVLNSFVIGYSH
ncbi:hypothetical protein HMPREF1448_01554 [Helicobacter pylori HP260AFi]|uniref:Uncharacterized protein n=1 Tax=Helicobacter pylori HP260AFii TaxID=1159077 RepID=A0ABC9SAN0_HELPX|nr:hypothetical protein HMPREF1416_01414 [Helicobacter pylori GAM260ASi]EMH61696.1 hypothetical protein HMPREF1448_01554 [Helicobacter pylori HP260AFi]EMH67583.1 hypothetical protein HMPREF1449_00499 [Helicobacter pylori HP260AFii]EMH68267.1 hypothetical protein HMPREF1450_00620 [Helicobacter pylori HP260ASii]